MQEYQELIDFLKIKGIQINQGFRTANKRIAEMKKNKVGNTGKICFEMISTAQLQDRITKIMEYIIDLEHLSYEYGYNERISFFIIWEKYLTKKTIEIIKGREIYNLNHPLFGYNPFFKKLLEAYANIENYEKCSELRDYYSLNK